jgi:hypothetical protein
VSQQVRFAPNSLDVVYVCCCADEEWRDIAGFWGYQVSSCGRVRSFRGHRGAPLNCSHFIRQVANPDGYLGIEIEAKKRSVSRLVAGAFVGPCPTGQQVAHLDGCKTNNHASNLAWVTAEENSRHRTLHGTQNRGMRGHTHQLTDAQVALVIDRLAAGVRQCDIAREFGVSRTLIYGIKVGRTWKHIPRGASNVSAG